MSDKGMHPEFFIIIIFAFCVFLPIILIYAATTSMQSQDFCDELYIRDGIRRIYVPELDRCMSEEMYKRYLEVQ